MIVGIIFYEKLVDNSRKCYLEYIPHYLHME